MDPIEEYSSLLKREILKHSFKNEAQFITAVVDSINSIDLFVCNKLIGHSLEFYENVINLSDL